MRDRSNWAGPMRQVRCAILATCALTVVVHASAIIPRSGRYAAVGGWGTLDIRGAGATRTFVFDTIGPNAHTCSISGALRGRHGQVDEAELADATCVFELVPVGQGWEPRESALSQCSSWCGARASITHQYEQLPPECEDASAQATRADFLAAYRARRFEEALEIAQALQRACSRYDHWIESDSLASDVAVTLYRLGRGDACLNALSATRAWRFESDRDLSQELAPTDYDAYISIARAIWTNRRMCKGNNNPPATQVRPQDR